MNYWKKFGLAVIAAMVVAALAASSASATTLEIGGAKQNGAVTVSASNEPQGGVAWLFTNTSTINLCTVTTIHETTTTFTGASVSGPISSLSFTSCERPVTVHKAGSLSVASITGTTNGTVTSAGTEATVGSPIGTLTCTTAASGYDIGTLTGATTAGNPGAHATMDLHGVINCGFLAPSVIWGGTYTVTTPTDLGVVS